MNFIWIYTHVIVHNISHLLGWNTSKWKGASSSFSFIVLVYVVSKYSNIFESLSIYIYIYIFARAIPRTRSNKAQIERLNLPGPSIEQDDNENKLDRRGSFAAKSIRISRSRIGRLPANKREKEPEIIVVSH